MIATERLELIPVTVDLVDAALSGRETLSQALGAMVPPTWPPEYLDDDALRWTLARLTEFPEQAPWLAYFILRKAAPRTLLGMCGYKGPPRNGEVEIGYGIVSDQRLRGYASEALAALCDRAWATPEVARIIGETLPELAGSIAVMRRAGFQPAGTGSEPGVIRFLLTRRSPWSDPHTRFLHAATWHGDLDEAEAILAQHPELATGSIHIAAVLGHDATVRSFLAADRANATVRVPPYGADALNYLGLSKYLRFDRSRTPGLLRAAIALLDAGADPNTGFWTTGRYPEFETALYGAAGVAHHPEMTRLLLERGADPNDGEAVYHSPESDESDAMKLLVETGRVTAENLAMMLIRKHDWHDHDGVKWLLEHGADPAHHRWRGLSPMHHAIARDNNFEIVELLLDHGADPGALQDGDSAVARAARRGRGDLLASFERRGFPVELPGVLGLIAACARGDADRVRAIAASEPSLVGAVVAQGGSLLAEFTGTFNTRGVELLLDLGVSVTALYQGDGYFGIAPRSTALHVAAWKSHAPTVRLLLARGAPLDARDDLGRTPLSLAVKACVDSYWTYRRTPECVAALLDADASLDGVKYPSGYAEVDKLLEAHGVVK